MSEPQSQSDPVAISVGIKNEEAERETSSKDDVEKTATTQPNVPVLAAATVTKSATVPNTNAGTNQKPGNIVSKVDESVAVRKKRKVNFAKDETKSDMEKGVGDTMTLFCKRDFMRYLLISKENLMKEEKERKERGRKSLNSMTEAEQLKLALEMSMK
mmetsp:Transcript_6845/g.8943  ORF Transcript_6845/g.8943 Transcript_6845/m.8943 type:complete len:158 (+) Transcript_6845:288-761(+)